MLPAYIENILILLLFYRLYIRQSGTKLLYSRGAKWFLAKDLDLLQFTVKYCWLAIFPKIYEF